MADAATKAATNPAQDPADPGFAFVRELAESLSKGPIELPGFPEVALRVQEVLSDDAVSSETVVRLLGAEPMLAARVVNLANSAAMFPSSTPVVELRTAVARVGFDSLRAAAVSFAMDQVRRRPQYAAIEAQLSQEWLESVTFASMGCVVARRCRRMSPDTALFAGLVAGVGRVYLLTRANAHPELFADPGAYQAIVRDWHANIARALLESWHVADEIIEAVQTYESRNAELRSGPPLPDVLAAASFLVEHRDAPETLADVLPQACSLQRLGLNAAACTALLGDSADEMAALRAALGR